MTGNPFVFYPSYRQIADLPLAERVAEMRKPEVRDRILADKPTGDGNPLLYLAQAWDWIFPLTDDPDYEPDASTSIAARARARGVSPMEAYNRLLDEEGHAMLLVAMANFENSSLDTVGRLIRRDDVVLGLGDGGAHYGMICDASFPTFLLAHWARDRKTDRMSVAEAVRELTSVPARVAGLADRGRIAVGYKADLNVIDHAALKLHRPVITYDLPAGGRRLDQTADGYVATVVSGEVVAETASPPQRAPGSWCAPPTRPGFVARTLSGVQKSRANRTREHPRHEKARLASEPGLLVRGLRSPCRPCRRSGRPRERTPSPACRRRRPRW